MKLHVMRAVFPVLMLLQLEAIGQDWNTLGNGIIGGEVLGSTTPENLNIITGGTQRMIIKGNGTWDGYIGIGDNFLTPTYHVDILTPGVGNGELMLRCRIDEDLNSEIGFINSAGIVSGVVRPALIGRVGSSQPGSALTNIGNISSTQDIAANNEAVMLYIASKGYHNGLMQFRTELFLNGETVQTN